jgi:hypothetical protein
MYWMLSGGLIFLRENHRERPLTEILNDQSFEHVHILMDRVLIERPGQRLSEEDFGLELVTLQHLVEGRYAPLRASLPINCRFCGIGTYSPIGSGKESVALRSTTTGTNIMQASAMNCRHCGHIEFFNVSQAPNWQSK